MTVYFSGAYVILVDDDGKEYKTDSEREAYELYEELHEDK